MYPAIMMSVANSDSPPAEAPTTEVVTVSPFAFVKFSEVDVPTMTVSVTNPASASIEDVTFFVRKDSVR